MDLDTVQTCRICRSNKEIQEMQLLLEGKLKSQVEIICGIEINVDDELKYLCHGCEVTIESSFRLRQLAQTPSISSDQQHDNQKEVNENVLQKVEEEQEEQEKFEILEFCKEDEEIYDEALDSIEIDDNYFVVKRKVIRKEEPDKEVSCLMCRRVVKERYLEDHQSKCNGKVTKYKCPFKNCNKRFVQRKSLKIHTDAQHFNQRKFECDLCGKTYASKDSLKGHMVAHRSERNETCFQCGAKFKSKLSLFKHKVVHENNFFWCSFCNARFKNKYDCSYHERVKHMGQTVNRKIPDRKFPCDECDKVYKTKDSLKRHIIRVHKNIKDFVCWVENCNARYGFHSSLKKHLAKKHPEIDLTGLKIVPDPTAELTQMSDNNIVLFTRDTELIHNFVD